MPTLLVQLDSEEVFENVNPAHQTFPFIEQGDMFKRAIARSSVGRLRDSW